MSRDTAHKFLFIHTTLRRQKQREQISHLKQVIKYLLNPFGVLCECGTAAHAHETIQSIQSSHARVFCIVTNAECRKRMNEWSIKSNIRLQKDT